MSMILKCSICYSHVGLQELHNAFSCLGESQELQRHNSHHYRAYSTEERRQEVRNTCKDKDKITGDWEVCLGSNNSNNSKSST